MNKEQETALEAVREKAESMEAMLEQFQVVDDATLAAVADKIKSIKTLKKAIEKEKDKIAAPAKEIIKHARETYDPFIKQCANAESVLKQRAAKYMSDREREDAEKKAKLAARVEKGTMKPETAVAKMEAMPEVQPTIRTDKGAGLRMSKRKVAKIVDPEKVPDEYWIIDEVRVRRDALARHKEGGEPIPGVEIVEETGVASV